MAPDLRVTGSEASLRLATICWIEVYVNRSNFQHPYNMTNTLLITVYTAKL